MNEKKFIIFNENILNYCFKIKNYNNYYINTSVESNDFINVYLINEKNISKINEKYFEKTNYFIFNENNSDLICFENINKNKNNEVIIEFKKVNDSKKDNIISKFFIKNINTNREQKNINLKKQISYKIRKLYSNFEYSNNRIFNSIDISSSSMSSESKPLSSESSSSSISSSKLESSSSKLESFSSSVKSCSSSLESSYLSLESSYLSLESSSSSLESSYLSLESSSSSLESSSSSSSSPKLKSSSSSLKSSSSSLESSSSSSSSHKLKSSSNLKSFSSNLKSSSLSLESSSSILESSSSSLKSSFSRSISSNSKGSSSKLKISSSSSSNYDSSSSSSDDIEIINKTSHLYYKTLNISIINTFKIPKNKMNCDAFKLEIFKLSIQYTIRFNAYGQNIKISKIDLKSNSVNFTQNIINGKTKYVISDLYKYNGIIVSIFKNTDDNKNNNLRLLEQNNNDDNLTIFAIKEYESINDISNYDYIVDDKSIKLEKYDGKYVFKFNPVIQININNTNDNIPYNDIYSLKLYKKNTLSYNFNLTDKKLLYDKKKFEIKYKEIKESKYDVELISIIDDAYEINYVYYDKKTIDIEKKNNLTWVILVIVFPLILLIIVGVIFIILKKNKKDKDKRRLNSTNDSDIFKQVSNKIEVKQDSKNEIINENINNNNENSIN